MTKTMTDATFGLDEAKIAELNAVVDRAQAAAAAFRKLDQKAVDDIVLAMVVAGLDAAIDLAGVAGSSRTRSSRTTWPPSSSTTTSRTRRPSASSTTTKRPTSTTSPSRSVS